MSIRIAWEPGMKPLGRAVVAIGVFDGVHLGHQDLLARTVRDARKADVHAVAVTFDRDPDQVVTPESAAPQLMTLDHKVAAIKACGIHTVLVVPFTEEMASTPAERFLDEVLGATLQVVAVHVGRDFRFGARAQGDLDTLYVWGLEHGADICPHGLVEVHGQPVTSTRVRALVAQGEVEAAEELLGHPTRVSGTVSRGRGEGATLGFPTANVTPVPFAAIPGDGVYAGIARVEDGTEWPAAISVGTPPTFPQTKDYLEAHLIGFEGDLYDQRISLDFVKRLRDQRRFGSLQELTAAIARDVRDAAEAVESDYDLNSDAFDYDEGYDTEAIEDPEVLAAAERAVASVDSDEVFETVEEEWAEALAPRKISDIWSSAIMTSHHITAPLEAEGIPFAWDPYAPQDMPVHRPAYGVFDRPFTLLVPKSKLPQARRILARAGFADEPGVERDPGPLYGSSLESTRRRIAWIVLLAIGLPFLAALADRLGLL